MFTCNLLPNVTVVGSASFWAQHLEAEEGQSLSVGSQPGLDSEIQAGQGYKVRPCFNKTKHNIH